MAITVSYNNYNVTLHVTIFVDLQVSTRDYFHFSCRLHFFYYPGQKKKRPLRDA